MTPCWQRTGLQLKGAGRLGALLVGQGAERMMT